MKTAELRAAHRHSSRHREALGASDRCGCFYCLSTYDSSEIVEWVDDGDTAICPRCGIDSVIGSASGLPVGDREFLRAMKALWFAR